MLAPMGLRLSPEKTRVVHIDDGFDFLGFNIRRMRKRGSNKWFVYTRPSKKAIASIKARVRAMTYRATLHHDPGYLLDYLGRVLRGWANYFRHGVSKRDLHRDRLLHLGADHGVAAARSTGSDGQNCGAGSACPAPGGSPPTGNGSGAPPASRSSGTATAATGSRPRGHRQPTPAEQQPHVESPVR